MNAHPRRITASRFGIFALVALSFPLSVVAQTPSPQRRDPLEASMPHERMTLFEGVWTADGEPGYKEICTWLPGGRRHMVCRWVTTAANAPDRETLYVLSYRNRDSVYIAHFAFPNGSTMTYHGRVEGDRWVMNFQPTPWWPANNRLRTIITVVPEGLRYVEESSVDGGPWKVTEDYRRRRAQ